jgi:hypothetical protein
MYSSGLFEIGALRLLPSPTPMHTNPVAGMAMTRYMITSSGIDVLQSLTKLLFGIIFPSMKNNLHDALSSAILRLLRPLARLMLKHGMAYGSFAELARKAFVEEGFGHLQQSGKRPTVSSVSALTGLTRKETKSLRERSPIGDEESAQRYSRAIRVISGWVNDSQFHDEKGDPAVLPFEGAGASFSALVKKYSGDIPPMAMLTVLESSQNVIAENGSITLKERAYIPMSTPVDKINILGADVAELIGTIGHNLEVDPAHRFFQRKVSNTAIRPDAMEKFRDLSKRKSQELLEEYHAWLSSHEVDADGDDADPIGYVAVGIYYTEQLNYKDSNNEPV